jgi:hypothetical protein
MSKPTPEQILKVNRIAWFVLGMLYGFAICFGLVGYLLSR